MPLDTAWELQGLGVNVSGVQGVCGGQGHEGTRRVRGTRQGPPGAVLRHSCAAYPPLDCGGPPGGPH